MNQEQKSERLSRISTLWSLVHEAHAGAGDAATDAQRRLLQRYCGAVYRYLLGALHDQDAATELFQEFALRFVRGDFRWANPQRGRFREYVKTALIHLVSDYRRAQAARPRPLPDNLPDPASQAAPDDTTAFVASWREELVNRTWEALAQASPNLHAVLLLHVENLDSPSPQLAERLGERLGNPVTAGNVRVMLHRARQKFAELLVEEVAHSLGAPSHDELIAELRELQLAKLCAPAVERRQS